MPPEAGMPPRVHAYATVSGECGYAPDRIIAYCGYWKPTGNPRSGECITVLRREWNCADCTAAMVARRLTE